MIDIPLNAKVECTDGPCGQSVSVIVDPKTLRVTHYVVQEEKRPHTQRLVPVDQVVSTTADMIRLACPVGEFAQLESFLETEYRQVEIPRYADTGTLTNPTYVPQIETIEVERERVPLGQRAMHKGATVEATDGKVGQVDELLVDSETEQITHLVLRKGHLWGQKEVVLPLAVVDKVVQDTVHLTLDQETISAMLAVSTKYRLTDVELAILSLKGVDKANEAWQTLKKLTKKRSVAVLNMAVLVKDEDGQTSLRETEDVDPRHGAVFGAITGGLIGLLGGPVGAVVGAVAGAATGGVAADRIDMGFPDAYLKKLQASLQPGSSALVILAKQDQIEKVMDALKDFDGQLLRQTLTDDMVS